MQNKMQKQVIVGTPKLQCHINTYLVTIFQLDMSSFESCTHCNFQKVIYKALILASLDTHELCYTELVKQICLQTISLTDCSYHFLFAPFS